MRKKAIITCTLALFIALAAGVAWGGHDPVTLKGYDGKELSVNSHEPYSPRQTCGQCHEYDAITNGYHFQQGRTDGDGHLTMSDSFDPRRPWLKSDGMFGKW